MTRRSGRAVGIGFGVALALAGTLVFNLAPALADGNQSQDRQKNKPKDNEILWDPVVQGQVVQVFWAEGKGKDKTATLVVDSKEANQWVYVYGDNPGVREAIVSGRACVGRFVVATGDRLEETALSAQGIEVYNLDTPCTATLVPGTGGPVSQPASQPATVQQPPQPAGDQQPEDQPEP
ncbi:MAG: hypothetical protein IT307_07815 [Chloroflexi bacterium]|nr:hypothetical protein [Chloroflexota bacterium]